MKLWAIVPVKPLAEGKSRLASSLPLPERTALNRRLLLHTLATIQASATASTVAVVSRDHTVLRLAQEAGAHPLRERGNGQTGEAQLNAALTQAAAFAQARGADAVLVVPTDLPLLTAEDIHRLIRASVPGRRQAVIAPSYNGGTNALLVAPPEALPFAFGPNSFRRHLRLAREAGVAVVVVESPNLAFDVDLPEDLARVSVNRGQ